ncbi:MAG: DUF177 domain-containing protein [Bacteroidetes bacterium]|nr:DUF177 domain-containing protein [Bacteroidales bacterium]MBU1009221.1 DUF177 domain-containing protein [Bacteroidota bacterium]
MNYFREFLLPIGGLGLGSQEFDFDLGKEFFVHTLDSEISDGRVKVNLKLNKQEGMIELLFAIKGEVVVPCDRCMDDCNQAIDGEYRLILKHGEQFQEESDEVIILPVDQHQFDISALLYEYIVLLIPMKRIHPEDEDGRSMCNPEVLKKLQAHSTAHDPDPRWDILKNIKTEN